MKKKKISKLFFTRLCAYSLAVVMAGTMIPAYPVMAKTQQESEEQDEAKEELEVETIEIATPQDLEQLAENCHIDEWSRNKIVSLTTDIDLAGSEFLNIPVFSGTFNGNGHTISNYRYNGDGYVTGFFRYIEEGGVVENLYITGNVTSSDEKQCIGAICGINNGTIRNCTFQGLVEGKNETGGIVGINEGTGLVQRCTMKGTVTGYYYTGGIAGKNFGTVDNCTNYANINNNSQWVEEDDEISVDIIQNIRENETDVKLTSGVDTGGIVGFSKGVIMRSINAGKIGYEHTGYNVGGIAGRQSGIVALCTNHGSVYGRKDIGGIVGQMEPYIELDEAESIREAVNKLHDLIQKTLDDMQEGTDVIQSDVDVLKSYSDAAIDQGNSLTDRISDFTDNNLDQMNSLSDRMESVLDMLPNIMDHTDAAGNSLKDLNNAIKKLNEDLNVSGKMSSTEYNETDYRRLSVATSVGGSASADNLNPDEGTLVTITANPDNGYELNGLNVTDAKGKAITTTQTGDDTYTFTMPKENVLVSAVYSYIGAFLAKSNEGGNITITNEDNGQVQIEAQPYNGYELSGNSVTIGGQSVALTNNKVTVNRSAYLSGAKPVIVEGQFTKKSNTHNVTPVSSTGGTITVESQEAAAGDTVTVHVVAAYNYAIDTLTCSDGTAINATSTAGEYTFTMPNTDVTVAAVFKFTGSTSDTNVSTESTVGGTVTAVRANGDQYYVTLTPSSGYEIPDINCLEISKIVSGAVDTNSTVRISKADMTESGGGYRYLLNYEGTPLRAKGIFTKSNAAKDITCTSGTGGVITASSSSAEAGDEIYLVSAAGNGYRLKTLSVSTASGTSISYTTESKRYKFVMPNENVKVTAVYEPIQMIITSNIGGSASCTGGNDTKVTLKVTPDSGYTVSSTPVVKNQSGATIALGKASAGTWTYEFYLDSAAEPATAQITFAKQNQNNATQDALDRINANAGTLNGKANDINMTVDKIRELITDDDGNVRNWNDLSPNEKTELLNYVSDLMDYTSEAGTAASEILSDLALIASIEAPYIKDAASAAHGDLDEATKHVQSIINSLQSASSGARGIVDYLNGQSDLNFSKLGEDFDNNVDELHTQLRGITDSIKNISDHAANYSDKVTADLEAVNDQLNVVFNLFLDKVENLDNTGDSNFYLDVSDDEIETATTGRVDNSVNKGVVQGDINVGGIAGSMAIDEEDPEDNAAGSTDFSLGNSYTTKCIINGSTNQGYVTSKKDGAGGIAGYMKFGVITKCKAYGSVESTEGDFVGGVCGQSLALIKNSYALCTLSGTRNVGGIAGFGTNIRDCYSMVNISDAKGRYGAIAGQIAQNDEDNKDTTEDSAAVMNNYYVGDDIYGIDNISYIGVAEPITYEELLAVEGMPTDFWHLKVTYKIDDMYLGTQELAYGDSLSKLNFPEAPAKDNCYGVWPDVSDKIMTGNLVIEGEYKANVTVVQSDNTNNMLASAEGEHEKALVLIEGVFTEDAVLHASVSDETVPEDVTGKKNHTVYQISLENTTVTGADTLAVRLLNPYKKATVWCYLDGEWQQVDSKVRGQYLQTTMKGAIGTFCIVEETSNVMKIIIIVVSAAVVVLLVLLIKKITGKHKTKEKKEKKTKKQKPVKKSKKQEKQEE